MHKLERNSYALRSEGGDSKSPGNTATVSIGFHGPRVYKYMKSCLFPIAISSKEFKFF